MAIAHLVEAPGLGRKQERQLGAAHGRGRRTNRQTTIISQDNGSWAVSGVFFENLFQNLFSRRTKKAPRVRKSRQSFREFGGAHRRFQKGRIIYFWQSHRVTPIASNAVAVIGGVHFPFVLFFPPRRWRWRGPPVSPLNLRQLRWRWNYMREIFVKLSQLRWHRNDIQLVSYGNQFILKQKKLHPHPTKIHRRPTENPRHSKSITKDFYCNLIRIHCNFRQNLKTAFIPFEKILNSRKKLHTNRENSHTVRRNL